jgi:amino acid transporter/nucleotide-binding universal stress UspA family protein
MSTEPPPQRTLGLLGATGVGVGAIVGGGVLALAGVAFETTGPSAIVAFALNGVVAFLTAASFAELSVRFPFSGGTYTYARRVLTVEAAFGVGWVVWFASVVAAVLYALGFAVFLVPFLEQIAALLGQSRPAWLGGRFALVGYAAAAVGTYAWSLSRPKGQTNQWATVGKIVVFGFLLLAGFIALVSETPAPAELGRRFRPFFSNGMPGLVQAMGYTFIALQGFDLIAAVAGEVKEPERTLPRAMFASLGLALAVYLPLLFLIVAVGSPSEPIGALAARDPETLVAEAARSFLGSAGYWLVLVAGLLSMLSALQANLMAASRFAGTMAEDRTLPTGFRAPAEGGGPPVAALRLTAGTILFLLVAVPDVAAAGAVSSLIFLVTFTLTHGIGFLARHRAGTPDGFRTPWYPAVPVVGGSACLGLGLYQAVAVPSAGVLAALWLSLGAVLYSLWLAPRAKAVDAASEGHDPSMLRLRGRQPLVLVPIANPASAKMLVTMARAIAPPNVSRVQLLSVVPTPRPEAEPPPDERRRATDSVPREIRDAQDLLGEALQTALDVDLRPEAVITIHDQPLDEIERLAEATSCETLLLGVGRLGGELMTGPLEHVLATVDADVVILNAPPGWRPDRVRSILVPSRGGTEQSPVRARLLANLGRSSDVEVTYLGVLPPATPAPVRNQRLAELRRIAGDEVGRRAMSEVVMGNVVDIVVERTADADLLVLGLQPSARTRATFGALVQRIAQEATCPVIMISQRIGWARLRRMQMAGRRTVRRRR